MKTSIKLKTIVLSLEVAVMMLTATNLNAQSDGSRGLFSRGKAFDKSDQEAYYIWGLMNRGGDSELGMGYNLFNQQFGDDLYGGYNLYNQTFGQEVPLGSGWLILTAAGAAYALKKRINNDKNQKS